MKHELTSVLVAVSLVVDRDGVQLFRFLSPNTGRFTLRRTIKSYWKQKHDEQKKKSDESE